MMSLKTFVSFLALLFCSLCDPNSGNLLGNKMTACERVLFFFSHLMGMKERKEHLQNKLYMLSFKFIEPNHHMTISGVIPASRQITNWLASIYQDTFLLDLAELETGWKQIFQCACNTIFRTQHLYYVDLITK